MEEVADEEANIPRSFSLLYRSSSRVSVVYSVFWAARSVRVSRGLTWWGEARGNSHSTMASTGHASWQYCRRRAGVSVVSGGPSLSARFQQRRRKAGKAPRAKNTHSAVDALGHVDVVPGRPPRAVLARLGLDRDSLSRADGFAELAGCDKVFVEWNVSHRNAARGRRRGD